MLSFRCIFFVSPGDTAQTIVKGVEFRFASIRRLFYEYFIVGDRPTSVPKEAVVQETCAQCGERIVAAAGGSVFTCSNFCSGRFAVCGREQCKDAFEAWCTSISKHGGRGARMKLDFAKRWKKLNCPQCQISMREEPLLVDAGEANEANEAPAPTKQTASVHRRLHTLPDICLLRHNHRTTAGPLNLANSLIDIIARLFPGKIDVLQKEVPAVTSRTLPVVLTGMDICSARALVGGQQQEDAPLVDFGAQQAVLGGGEAVKRGDKVGSRPDVQTCFCLFARCEHVQQARVSRAQMFKHVLRFCVRGTIARPCVSQAAMQRNAWSLHAMWCLGHCVRLQILLPRKRRSK